MKRKDRIVIAFDVDGCLRCNCTPTCPDPNPRIVELLKILSTFKNVRLMVWSGGGKAYAENIINRFELPKCFGASKLDPETWVYGRPKIAIDDQQAFSMADINLIVREK